MTIRRFRFAMSIIFIVLCILLIALIATQDIDGQRVPPATPGGVRVIEDGQWVYYTEIYQGTGHIVISGGYTITKTPLGIEIDVEWPGSTNHTWVDVQTHRVER
jgi:hypothetical protein